MGFTTAQPGQLQIDQQAVLALLLKSSIIMAILFGTWAASLILGRVISKAVGRLNQRAALRARSLVSWSVWLSGILLTLNQLGLDMIFVFAILATGAMVLILAMRNILPNLASYEVIRTYSPFEIGDWIQTEGWLGRVVDITWMDTVLMTGDNEAVRIPNSRITSSVVINRTTSGETRIPISFALNNGISLSEAERILLEAGIELVDDLSPGSEPEVRVTGSTEHTNELTLLLKISNPAKSQLIASEIRKRALGRLSLLQAE